MAQCDGCVGIELSTRTGWMNTKEKIYTGLVIALGVLVLIGFVTILAIVYPKADNKGAFIMVSHNRE